MAQRFLLSFLLLISVPIAAHAERRVALIIGNGAYKSAPALVNPARDAEAMAAMLKLQDFDVVLGTDLDRDALSNTIGRFAEAARAADVALLFYAGHSIQIDGKNLLIPIDAVLRNEFEAKQRTVVLDDILNHTMTDAKIKLVLLDACRDNPFAKEIAAGTPKTRSVSVTTGYAQMNAGAGTLLQFATAAGSVASDGDGQSGHSPFTNALLKHLPTPNLEIGLAMRAVRAQVIKDTRESQQPWENSNFTGEFYMKRVQTASLDTLASPQPTPSTGQLPSPTGTSSFDPRVLELAFWDTIKTSNNPSDFRAYIEKYPQGTFVDLARSRADGLTKMASASPSAGNGTSAPISGGTSALASAEASTATEDALGLQTDSWKEVQRRLSAMGYGTRGVDGRVGDGTRVGLKSWQSARGYSTTGYLNKLQYDALLAENVPAAAVAAKRPSRDDDDDDKPARRGSGRTTAGRSGGNSGGGGGSSAADAAAAAIIGGIAGGVLGGVIGRHR